MVLPSIQPLRLKTSETSLIPTTPKLSPYLYPTFLQRHLEHHMLTEKKLITRKRRSHKSKTFNFTMALEKSSRTKLFSVKKGKFSTYAVIFKRMYLYYFSNLTINLSKKNQYTRRNWLYYTEREKMLLRNEHKVPPSGKKVYTR